MQSGAEIVAARKENPDSETMQLMEAAVEHGNMHAAYRRGCVIRVLRGSIRCLWKT